jgi:hypothetical protein
MSRFIYRFIALSIVCAACAFGQQGSFAQIAYGGSWQTTFTLLNESDTFVAFVTLNFFGDNGLPLNVPIQGAGTATSYTLSIVPGGLQSVVLSSSDPSSSQGWASIDAGPSGTVRGQATFQLLLPNKMVSEAVIPLSTSGSAMCVVPSPAPDLIVLPFDNTTGQYVTSVALANTTQGALFVPIEFVDQSNNLIVADTLSLTPLQHVAVVLPQAYPALAGQKGTLRIHQSTLKVTVLGLLSNATNSITTILPFTN